MIERRSNYTHRDGIEFENPWVEVTDVSIIVIRLTNGFLYRVDGKEMLSGSKEWHAFLSKAKMWQRLHD